MTTIKRLRVGVIGAGVMGRHHANVYAALPHVDLVAIADPDPAARAELSARYAARSYASLDELLENSRLDAASVAAPTSLHYQLTRQLLEAGVHVLVEKPVATCVAQAQELVSLSRQQGLVLQVGHITRFYKAVEFLSNRIQNPHMIEARRLTPDSRITDVGVILDLMIHDIDIALGLVQAEVADLTVAGHSLNGSPFEDVAAAQIVFEDGCIARFLASRVAPSVERVMIVSEPSQALHLDFSNDPSADIAIYRRAEDTSGYLLTQMDKHLIAEDNPLRKELEHFLARIRRGALPIGTLDDDLRSLELATRLIDKLPLRSQAVLS